MVGDVDETLRRAAELGGRVDCVSLLSTLGVFVWAHDRLHIQLSHGDSRLPPRARSVIGHWRATRAGREDLCADVVEALAQAVRCQQPRHAVATLDSAWHEGIVSESEIAEVFRLLPRRYRALRPLLDPRAESGSESLVRLMLRALGCRFRSQARVKGVGRVDFLVDGWLIVECDSRRFHDSWDSQRIDRRRDLAAAQAGFVTLRLIAEDILYHPEAVQAALTAVIRVHNSSLSGRRIRGARKPA